MACVESTPPVESMHVDSEREEGEIVDELDELSDISSEEEYLLRQRLYVLETYNNALERKAKGSTNGSTGYKKRKGEHLLDLSDISTTELEEISTPLGYKHTKERHNLKLYSKHKRRKETESTQRNKEHKKKPQRGKKKTEKKILIISESSEESDIDSKNRKRELADAVKINKQVNDTSTLRARLQNMLCVSKTEDNENTFVINTETDVIKNNTAQNTPQDICFLPVTSNNPISPKSDIELCDNTLPKISNNDELLQESNPGDVEIEVNNEHTHNNLDSVTTAKDNIEKNKSSSDSDEDLELLRQNALQTKTKASQADVAAEKKGVLSDEEDSDTYELRMICLRSALLKQAIERKREQKMIKRISLSQSLHDDLITDEICSKIESENNTDIESVDMDIGSDGEGKDNIEKITNYSTNTRQSDEIHKNFNISIPNLVHKEDDFEEDEDVLRAKLLTSLSKNLPNLINPTILDSSDGTKVMEPVASTLKSVPEEKQFIINVAESDSETEHEATKNLTKMHIKLSEQVDFQHKLDQFLKSTRMEVEKSQLPNIGQPENVVLLPKSPEKFVAKPLTHLPKSEQIEYRNLVKRMVELEKIKQVRNAAINMLSKQVPLKETLKPRNITVDSQHRNNNLEEQIALSRKRIAEESARMLKLREERTKLFQKYKIVSTELKNVSTAITLNKREQKTVIIRLTKIRAQHQMLLKSSPTTTHSNLKDLPYKITTRNKILPTTKLQKENDPTKEEHKNPQVLKSLKVSVVNDLKNDNSVSNPKLSVQVDVSSNMKTVKLPPKDRIVNMTKVNSDVSKTEERKIIDNRLIHPSKMDSDASLTVQIKVKRRNTEESLLEKKINDDYESPLQALDGAIWEEDPNGVLCPFEVGGNCKDPDCKFLHPKIPSVQ